MIRRTARWPTAVEFLDPGPLVDGDLSLVLRETQTGGRPIDWAPRYLFEMRHAGSVRPVGQIDLRVADSDWIRRYAGHFGYRVETLHRGRRYAARACRLLMPLARAHGLDPLWITCNPDNLASRRTCEILGARLVETVPVPRGSDLWRMGDRWKCRYRLDLTP